MHLLQQNSFKISDWSGGQTTELLILPTTSSYQDRNFSIRISSALIRDTFSQFTSVPGFERIILPLSGTLHLKHQLLTGVIEQELKSFELGRFSGDWQTEGRNEAHLIDFNVMFDASKLDAKVHLLNNQNISAFKSFNKVNRFIWCYTGQLSINQCVIQQGDAFVCKEEDGFELECNDSFVAILVEW